MPTDFALLTVTGIRFTFFDRFFYSAGAGSGAGAASASAASAPSVRGRLPARGHLRRGPGAGAGSAGGASSITTSAASLRMLPGSLAVCCTARKR